MYSYADLNKVKFFEDPTNKNSKYLRTRIRLLLKNDQNLKYKLSKSLNAFCRLKNLFDNLTKTFF